MGQRGREKEGEGGRGGGGEDVHLQLILTCGHTH